MRHPSNRAILYLAAALSGDFAGVVPAETVVNEVWKACTELRTRGARAGDAGSPERIEARVRRRLGVPVDGRAPDLQVVR